MYPAIRTPYDSQRQFSLAARDTMPEEEDMTRQEFLADTDVTLFVTRYGLPQAQPMHYGEADFTLDKHAAMLITREAQQAWKRLDPAIQAKYGDWETLLTAAQAGDFDGKGSSDDMPMHPSHPVKAPETPVKQPETPVKQPENLGQG